MKLKDAVSRAAGNEDVRKLRGYFLGSGFASLAEDGSKGIKEWTLLYYNPNTRTVIDCFVSDKFVTVGEETPALGDMQELHAAFAKIEAEKALEIAKEKCKKRPVNTLVSLHNKEFDGKKKVVWTIGFVTADISVTALDIDAADGKVLREETTRLVRKL